MELFQSLWCWNFMDLLAIFFKVIPQEKALDDMPALSFECYSHDRIAI